MLRQRWTGLAAFVLTMLVLRAIVARWCGPPRSPALESKWSDFERDADEYDIVFIGTSHVERQIDPRAVDGALAERGVSARSYNLGMPKMSVLEGAELIERLARRRPAKLKLVVLEPTLYLYDADNWSTDRAMAEHDWSGAWLAARLTWGSEQRRQTGFFERMKRVAPHGLAWVCRMAGLRRGDCLFSRSGGPSGALAPRHAGDARGFVPLPADDDPALGNAWRERFRRFMTTLPDWNGNPLSSAELAYFDRLIRRVRELGATPVFLLGPKVKRDSHTAAVYASHRARYADVPLLDFLRGNGGAALYNLRLWHDFDHLNADGAALFSRQLAAELAPLVPPRGPASRGA